jgi:predicted nucleic acid-binding protein
MTPTLVDSNVILDVVTSDPTWGAWSIDALERCADESELVINPIVYAEVSIGFSTIEALEESVPASAFRREALPWEAGFLAGKCFLKYRQQRGARTTPLPDFFIGAHAAINGYRLLTRDAARFRSYFPTLELIAPAR